MRDKTWTISCQEGDLSPSPCSGSFQNLIRTGLSTLVYTTSLLSDCLTLFRIQSVTQTQQLSVSSIDHFYDVSFKRTRPLSKGWELIELPLRASNEGLLRPRVARAVEVQPASAFPFRASFLLRTPSLSGRDGKVPNRAHRGTTFRSGAFASERDLPSCPYLPSLDCPFDRPL
jgi:hypothetical protein